MTEVRRQARRATRVSTASPQTGARAGGRSASRHSCHTARFCCAVGAGATTTRGDEAVRQAQKAHLALLRPRARARLDRERLTAKTAQPSIASLNVATALTFPGPCACSATRRLQSHDRQHAHAVLKPEPPTREALDLPNARRAAATRDQARKHAAPSTERTAVVERRRPAAKKRARTARQAASEDQPAKHLESSAIRAPARCLLLRCLLLRQVRRQERSVCAATRRRPEWKAKTSAVRRARSARAASCLASEARQDHQRRQ